MSDTINALQRELYILEDENNPHSSRAYRIHPTTNLDQVFDNLSPTNKTLRTIIAELRQEILTGGTGPIIFPVTTVNGKTGDVQLSKSDLGLDRVDNTKDSEKPLSDQQRSDIMNILANYDFNADLSDLYDHLRNSSNPHGVTLEHINRNNAVTELIQQLIGSHNNSQNTHQDIRNALQSVRSDIDSMNDRVEQRIANALNQMSLHYHDDQAHRELFDLKENKSNKSIAFDSNSADHLKYPSTRAVVEFVASKLSEFSHEISNPDQWIDDIIVVDSRSNLPSANVRSYRKAYYIRYGESNSPEIAICRKNGSIYSWDYSSIESSIKFDSDHFVETENGLSLNIDSVGSLLMNSMTIASYMRDVITTQLPSVMDQYYTKDDIDQMHFIKSIHIIGGTQHGTIRYYINDDRSTMSSDINIPGLNRLAFLETITENEIDDQAIHSRHILDRAIKSRHLDDQAVSYRNISAEYGTIIGNISDTERNTASPITLQELADKMDPYIAYHGEGFSILALTPEKVEEIVLTAFRDKIGWYAPLEHANISLDGENLVVDYEEDAPTPNVYIDENGELVLESDETITDISVSKFTFEMVESELIMSVNA